MLKHIAILAGLCATATFASAAGGEDEIRKAESAWSDAVKAGDQAKLDGMLADGLVYTHSTGSVDSKGAYLTKLKSGAQKYASLDTSDMAVHMYGDTAIVNAKIRMTGATNGVPFDNKLLYTHAWVKQHGRWQLVSHQTTKQP